MKKRIALFLALMFLFSAVPAFAEGETGSFTGILTEVTPEALTVVNEYGTVLTFTVGEGLTAPEKWSLVTVDYEGNPIEAPVATAVTAEAETAVKTETGTISAVSGTKLTLKNEAGKKVTFNIGSFTLVSGEFANGAKATVEYYENGKNIIVLSVTAEAVEQAVKTVEVDPESTTNKTATGTVTKLSSSKITIKTKKGKTWTFKRSDKTKKTGKYELKVGATVIVTYDGYASKSPLAKKVKVTKAASDKVYKTKKGIVEYYHDGILKLESGLRVDCWNAKHTGGGAHESGALVKVTYYKKNGENIGVKVKWYLDK